jgi:beta-lactamase regulating signal transducer with metallopeptidase domain
MSSLFTLRALLFAGECFAASTLMLSLAWLASALLKQAGLRHLVWLTAFVALLVLPAAALIVPPRIVVEHSAAPQPLPSYVEHVASAAPIANADPALQSALPSFDARDLAIGLLAIWLAGVCWVAMRLVAGALGLAALRRQSHPHPLDAADLPGLESHRRECELRLSETQGGPITWGFLKPVILLPRNSVLWPRERLQAVLLHELAHVRRRDSLTQSLSLVACALYWPNPLIWMAARALRREAEIAADDAVIVSGVRPSAYAGELLQLAEEFRGRRAVLSGVSMAAQSALEARVKSVLTPNQLRTGVTAMDALKIACLGVAATALLAFARPDMVAAQDAVAPPPPAAAPATPPDAVPAAPPAPSALPAMPAMPEPPAAAEAAQDSSDAADATPSDKQDGSVQIRETRHGHDLKVERTVRIVHMAGDTHLDGDKIEQAEMQARQAQVELAKIEPEIEKALAAAKIDEKVAKAMQDADPKIRAEVAREMAQIQPTIRKALAEAHISERVARALREAQPKLDAAAAKMQKRIVIYRDGQSPGPAPDADSDPDQQVKPQ